MICNRQVFLNGAKIRRGRRDSVLVIAFVAQIVADFFQREVRVQNQSAKQAAALLCCQLGSQALNRREQTH